MTVKTPKRPRNTRIARPAQTKLSDAQLAQVFAVLQELDGIELKVTIPASSHRTTIGALPVDPVEAEPRQVYFFDTPNLALNAAGIVVRARRIQGGSADTVVKLRPVVPSEIPKSLRSSGACKVELDAMPGSIVFSASLKGNATGDEVHEVVRGDRPLSKMLSKEQRAFFRQYAPPKVDLNKLAVLGPTFVLKTSFYVKKMDRKVNAEIWLYPDGARVLELSTKALPKEAFQVASEFRAYLAKRGIDLAAAQATKTKSALDYYSKKHKSGSNGASR